MICSRVVNWAVAVASVIRMYQHRVSPEPGTLRAVLPIEKAFPNRLCGVLRTQDAEAGFQACLAAMEGGIGSIEITTTVPSCYDMIRGLRASTGDSHPIGVGTVWDPGAVSEAKDAGAAFVVTPVLLPEVAVACKEKDILCVLGALTPTEIYQARLAGAKLVKVFPVGPVGGVEYIRALGGPMGGVPLWVSGGVEIGQIRGFVDLGVKVVGLTDALFSASAMANRDMEAIRAQAARAAQEVLAAAGTPDAART
ncbi:MAG: bifunctional 4-hydroxy-2-oxoglutarate aldolase/2-dehydro-3-deoxy-phosphogluconate aldolase [Chloroflexi bacterium]|nr:MAG: bifunctional 4-hydroxy-2-oxoglutarate aldolase/2-dehydro-3-deoxy-phosphogluconate aldolase [Chloroflexota bacterium]